MSNDLISREALIKEYLGRCRTEFEIRNRCMTDENVIAIIQNAPTVEPEKEVVPVCELTFDADKLKEIVQTEVIDKIKSGDLVIRSEEIPQGNWIDTGGMNEYWAEEYQCSICGAKDHWHNYCPNCGADMRGEENDK